MVLVYKVTALSQYLDLLDAGARNIPTAHNT